MIEKVKIGVAALFVAAGIAGFYYFGDKLMIARVGMVLGGLVAAALLFLTTTMGQEFKSFTQESIVEVRKVVWPTRKETLQTTAVVFVFVLVMALLLWLIDGSLLWIMKKLIGRSE